MLLMLHHSRHSWCVHLYIYFHLHFDDFGEGLSVHFTFTFYPSVTGILGPYVYHFIPFTTYLYLSHTNICVLFARILIFSCLVPFSAHVTSPNHTWPPNMMYRALSRSRFFFERIGNDNSVGCLSEL